MRSYKSAITCLLASLLVVFIAGCGQETVSIPGVVSVTPAQGATNVVVNTPITATFSMPMSAATITTSTFTVAGSGGTAVAGTVAYSGLTATFTPTAVLAYGTTYTATITTGAATPGGAGLMSNFVWTFSTITPPPTVVSTTPANGAVNVPVGQVLTATFSLVMAPATISATTFTVSGTGGAAVAGTVTYSGSVATFTPTASLANNTQFTATITTGATSVAGSPLAANYVWKFTTITPPPAVIATVPVNTATGVPVNQVLTATFNEAMSCTTFPATAFTVSGPGATPVSGTIGCSGAVATFTPAASLAFNTVFTATITTGAQSLAGTPLVSNYVWTFRTVPATTPPIVISTVPINGAVGVPINQAITATFSEAMNPATIAAATFTVTGPGGASVTGAVTYVAAGSVATFTPAASLAVSTVYTATVTTGAMDLGGTALAQNYVWTFTTSAVPLSTQPTVISTVPLNAATGVPLNEVVSATFSKAMNPATISALTFKLTGPGTTAVSGLVAYAAIGNTLTFTPTANLAPSTLFTATITTGAQDLAGNALASNYVWTFTTGTTTDTIPPQVVSTVPANSAINVPLNQAVSATFTEAMNPLTITTATFELTGPGGTEVAGTVSYDAINFIATFTPAAPLITSSSYTAKVTNGATDMAGNPLGTTGAPNPWTFMTGSVLIAPPIVLGPTISPFGGLGGGAGLTNQGIHTVINGNIATTAASSLITGFHDTSLPIVGAVWPCSYTESPLDVGQVNGVIDSAAPPPTVNCPNEGTALTMAIATQAALEARTAYTTLQGLPSTGVLAAELGGTTIYPGVYTNGSTVSILNGDLTLDARGDPNASWVFQISSSLTVGAPVGPQTRSIILAGGAKSGNIFWAVGSGAVINYGGGGTMVGTIVSQAGITISSPGQSTSSTVTTLNGRVLALGASVTMVNTVINVPAP